MMATVAVQVGDSPGEGGGCIPGLPGEPAFTLTRRQPSSIPVLIAVPHAGRSYPNTLIEQMREPEAAALKLEDRYVDMLARAVSHATGAGLLIAQAPRAMIDLNRAPEDMDWEMLAGAGERPRGASRTGRRARGGLGLIPRRLPGMGEIWRRPMLEQDLAERIAGVHAPYHAALGNELAALKARWGAALLIDLHSMPPLGPKRGAQAAADFVIGDRFGSSCDGMLCAAAFDHLAAAGRRAAHNRPYAGGYVLDRHTAPARGFHGLQVEICREIYLDENLRELGPGFEPVVALLSSLVRRLAADFAGLGGVTRQAAE